MIIKIIHHIINYLNIVPPAGLKPATLGLEIPCSIQLSYGGILPGEANLAPESVNDRHISGVSSKFPASSNLLKAYFILLLTQNYLQILF